MLQDKIIEVPTNLLFEETITFVNSFANIREEKKFIFDFAKTSRIDPFSLLFLSSELQIFKKNNPTSNFQARNFTHLTYAGHMGFFQAFGLDFGNYPGQAKGSNTYSPITILSVAQIKETARELMVNPGVVLEDFAENVSKILTQNKDKNISDVLRYSIREILRNIVEHSESKQFGYCAQYLPFKQKVNFAVLDRGVGIKETLSNNPKIAIQDDLDAINWALKPGVSGKIYPGQKNKPKGEWANSGYGLFMTSNICKMGGSFFISTGNKGLLITDKQSREFDLETHGTAIYLDINLNSIYELSEMLKDLRNQVPKNVFLTPSKSSMDNNTKSLNK